MALSCLSHVVVFETNKQLFPLNTLVQLHAIVILFSDEIYFLYVPITCNSKNNFIHCGLEIRKVKKLCP